MPDPAAKDTQPAPSPMREQRDRFLAFAFASADLFLEVSEEGRVTFALGAAKGVTGIEDDSLVGKKWLELFSVYEQATMINLLERAKPGVRCGPKLVNLSETMDSRKAILTGIKMPGSGKFYITLGLSNAIMARIAHAVSQREGFEVLGKESFAEAALKAVSRARQTGMILTITFFDFAPTRLERNRMGEQSWAKMREQIAEFLISEAFDGYSAAEVGDGRYCFVQDTRLAGEALAKKFTDVCKQADPSSQGVAVKIKPVAIDAKALDDLQAEAATKYILDEFEKGGTGSLPINSLKGAYEIYLKANTPKIRELEALIERSGFSLLYQPVVDLATGEAAHFEIFCQFESGKTAEWVHFAQDVGLATQLDTAMYERAINHVKFKAGTTRTKFSVNLTLHSVENNAFVETFLERLETHKTLSERLLFEIAESTSFKNEAKIEKFIAQVRKIGFRVALDHFNPEPAWLPLLERLKPDIVKIDGKFIRRVLLSPRDAGLVRSLAETCQNLKIDVVAKWVEEKGQAQFLKEAGVGFGQGYHFGRPSAKSDYNGPRE